MANKSKKQIQPYQFIITTNTKPMSNKISIITNITFNTQNAIQFC